MRARPRRHATTGAVRARVVTLRVCAGALVLCVLSAATAPAAVADPAPVTPSQAQVDAAAAAVTAQQTRVAALEASYARASAEAGTRQRAVSRAAAEYAVEATLGARFPWILANLYRDGRDSVAFHGDRMGEAVDDCIVALVSLRGPRRLRIRPKRGGGPARAFDLGHGDLLVMGGSCQRDYEHGVPKVARAEPRISVMLRSDRVRPAP